MLAIKLKRIGKKNQPSFRLVIQEKRSKLNGRFLEDVGYYNPITKAISVNNERVIYWMGIGAKPTATMHNLLVKQGVINEKKVAVHKRAIKEKKA